MLIEILNWEKYNPRQDVKHTTWFRLENTFWSDGALTSLDSDGKVVWMTLLSLASQRQDPRIDVDQVWLTRVLGIPASKIEHAINHFKVCGKIKIPTSRGRHVNVTRTSRSRNATDGRTDGRNIERQTTWETGDVWAKAFANLMVVAKYADVFDREHERRTLQAHADRYSLTPSELEQVTWDFRQWSDGPNGAKIRSPRGTLATFVRGHVERRGSKPKPQVAPTETMLTEADYGSLLD